MWLIYTDLQIFIFQTPVTNCKMYILFAPLNRSTHVADLQVSFLLEIPVLLYFHEDLCILSI